MLATILEAFALMAGAAFVLRNAYRRFHEWGERAHLFNVERVEWFGLGA